MLQCATLSVTEAELVAGIETAQDMLFVKGIVELLGSQVQLPMIFLPWHTTFDTAYFVARGHVRNRK